MSLSTVGKKVALGTITTALLAASVLFFVIMPTFAQSGGEKFKSAWNITQGRDAEDVDAEPGDIIEYSLKFRNTDSSSRSVRIEDNISDVLKLARIENRGGADLLDSVLRWPSVELDRGESTTERFRVRVLAPSRNASDRTMANTYGNTVHVRVTEEDREDGMDVSKSKTAYNITRSQNAESVIARPGDIIEYRLQVRNTDTFGSEITIEDDIADMNDLSDLLAVSDNGERAGDSLRWRNVQISANQTVTRTFRVRIKEDRYLNATTDHTMTNIFGNTVSVRVSSDGRDDFYDDESVRSVNAYNTSQGRPAEEIYARAGDIITYTLSFRNDSNSTQIITIETDVSDVLYLSEIINFGGGRMLGSVIRYDRVSVGPDSRVDRSFQVRVRSILQSTTDTIMSMSYGNGVDVRVWPEGGIQPPAYTPPAKGQPQAPTIPYKAPATGTSENVAMLMAGLLTGGIYVINRRHKFSVNRVP